MQNTKHYSDYFYIPREYKPNMDKDTINATPDLWLQFYPHQKYVSFLKQLLATLDGGDKSIWLSGNYGTGKSYAALVTQKLFMDDESRVKLWFKKRQSVIDNCDDVESKLFDRRAEGVFVVYDYNASGVGANEGFLVRLERTVTLALQSKGLVVPAKANIDEVIERIVDDGDNFLKSLDKMRGDLAYLRDYKSIQQIVNELRKPKSDIEVHAGILSDVQLVLYSRSIFLSLTVERFKNWIQEILNVNSLKRIVYIFDEFSTFLDKNKSDLKTFEEVTEKGLGKFFFIPVTHLSIKSFWGEGSETANRAKDRFYFSELQMPTNTAFQLAADALKPVEINKIEWENERAQLWSAISSFADSWFDETDVSRQSLHDIIPIHPMAAFLLKFLSTSTGSNQRSIFEYLKGSANGQEFQEFMQTGGPTVPGKQFLTPDYLWKYFIERDDLGQNKEVIATRTEFSRIYNREFQNRDDDDDEIRVLKTVLLFCLLNKLNPDGHVRLKPNVQNIELSFLGDGSIVNIKQIVKILAEKQCFSLVQDNIEPFYTSVGNKELDDEVAKLEPKFHELLLTEDTKEVLEKHTLSYRNNFSKRFDIRVSDVAHIGATYFQEAQRRKYASDDSSILIWFVIAKTSKDQLAISEKIAPFLDQFKEHRIICVTFPELTFCQDDKDAWNAFVLQYAQYNLELDAGAKKQRLKTIEKMKKDWSDILTNGQTIMKLTQSQLNNISLSATTIVWAQFKVALGQFLVKTLPHCPDMLAKQIALFGDTGLKSWALAGITLETTQGQIRPIIAAWKNEGITDDIDWFEKNPSHCLSQIHDLFSRKASNTIARGVSLSIRKVYIELQRAPYGLRYNALSAFVLGFVLKDMLTKNYQWTNGQRTETLNSETLASIIEDVIKDDGKDNIRAEKEICKLSKEEKIFVEKAPKMFGIMSSTDDGTVETALQQITDRIMAISSKVPLWVLPLYIKNQSDPQCELLERIIDFVCAALSNSAKNSDERQISVKAVGEIILSTDGVVECLADYIKAENFVFAFALYVNTTAPKLKLLADSLGDVAGAYLEVVKSKSAETAGWLWKRADISLSIDSAIEEYEAIEILTKFSNVSSFRPFSEHIANLKTFVTLNGKLPKTVIIREYASLTVLLSQVANGAGWVGLPANIKLNHKDLAGLFYDATYKESLRIVCKLVPEAALIPHVDVLAIYKELDTSYTMTENVFISELRQKLEDYSRNSVSIKIKSEWRRITNSDTPNDWSIAASIPARLALDTSQNCIEVLAAISTPENFSSSKLLEVLQILIELQPVQNDKAHKMFVSETIPSRYSRFNVAFSSLVEFLKHEYGGQPNKWPRKPNVDEFLREQYKTEFARQIADRISKKNADELKEKLCELAKDNPELGLLFWE